MSKHYGVGAYRAQRIAPGVIAIIAIGSAPNANTVVTIEQLPWRIYPPRFGLFFSDPAVVMPAVVPFIRIGVFLYPKGNSVVTIFDAAGAHAVDIVDDINLTALEVPGSDQFAVYQQIGRSNCIVAPADALLPAIYYRVYGPASEADCNAWAVANCGK